MNRTEAKAGLLVLTAEGKLGITTDAARAKTDNIAVQIVGGSYPILVALESLTIVESEPSLGQAEYDNVVEGVSNRISERLYDELSDETEVDKLIDTIAQANGIEMDEDEYGDLSYEAQTLVDRVYNAILEKIAHNLLGY